MNRTIVVQRDSRDLTTRVITALDAEDGLLAARDEAVDAATRAEGAAPFPDRAAAEAAHVPAVVTIINVDGLQYRREPGATDLVTADGATWAQIDRKNTLDATRAPLPTDDASQGYAPGSRWLWQGQEWVLADAAAGEASWISVTEITPLMFGGRPGAVTEMQAALNTAAMQAAYDYAAAAGRPLMLGPHEWVVHLPLGDQDLSTAGYRVGALRWDADSAVVLGVKGVTRIRAFEASGRYAVVQMVRRPLQNGVSKIIGGLYADVIIDANCADTTTWEGHQAAMVAAGLRDVSFERVTWCNSGHYGLGLQNGGHQNVRMIDCIAENTAKDAVDLKNNVNSLGVSVGLGLHIRGMVVRNCGQANDPQASALIDLMGLGVIVEDVTFDDIRLDASNLGALIRIKPGLDSELARGIGGWGAIIRNITVRWREGAPPLSGALLDIRAPYVLVDGVQVHGAPGGVGVLLSQPFCRVINGRFPGLTVGVHLRVHVSAPEANPFGGADDCLIENNVFEGCATSIETNRYRTRILGNAVLSGTVGVYGSGASAAGTVVDSNYFSEVATPILLTDSTSSHLVVNNIGAGSPAVRTIYAGGSVSGQSYFSPGGHRFRIGTEAASAEALRVQGAPTDINYLQVVSAGTGGAVHVAAAGGDASVDLRLSPKGGGRLRFGEHTSGPDTSITGYITIKDGSGVVRKLAVIS